MKNILVPDVPEDEQLAIANYIQHETTKIDTLIGKSKRLISLLQEKRQAIISHAVTKGLDPNVPMKNSGIDWLGEIPKHWDIYRLKDISKFSGGGTPSKDNLEYWNGDIPWVSPKDMKHDYISETKDKITELGLTNSSTSLVKENSLLMVVRSGILQRTIPVGINTKPVSLNQDMKALSLSKTKCSSRFFQLWVQGLTKNLLLEWAKQGATVESIEFEYMANSFVPLPKMEEQNEILEYIENRLAKINAIISKAQQQIEKFKEHRSALISAAVTGKIDVREWNIEEKAA
jgi:type I restriction enzyme S subunit